MKYQVQPQMCADCIFRQDGVALEPMRFGEICGYLIEGTPHLCHANEKLACRGGRDYQLLIWYRLGIIPAPTDEALELMIASNPSSAKKHTQPIEGDP